MENLKEKIKKGLLNHKPDYLQYDFKSGIGNNNFSFENKNPSIFSNYELNSSIYLMQGFSPIYVKAGTMYVVQFPSDFITAKIKEDSKNVSLNFKIPDKKNPKENTLVELLFSELNDFINPDDLNKKGLSSYISRGSHRRFEEFKEFLTKKSNLQTSIYFNAFYNSHRLNVYEKISFKNEDKIVGALDLIKKQFNSVDKSRLSLGRDNEVNKFYEKLFSNLESYFEGEEIKYELKTCPAN